MRAVAKSWANAILRRFGVMITRAGGGWGVQNLRRDFAPATVVDVGTASGTPALYEAFPDAYLVLIEPVQEFSEHSHEILSNRRGEYIASAVGSFEGVATMTVEHRKLTKSSFMHRTTATAIAGGAEEREIAITTLDHLLHEREWTRPIGLKIDAEGYELEIVRGANELLQQCEFVIAEVSAGRRFTNSYRFAEFVAAMHEHGFDVADILTLKRFRDGTLVFMDVMFTPVHR